METVLFADERYRGKYVALRSATDKRVVASGDDPSAVKAEAVEKHHVTEPLIFFVAEHIDDVSPLLWSQ